MRSVVRRVSSALVWLLVTPLRGYRVVSRYLPPTCRFTPSCSAYAIEALQVHGPLRGTWLTVRRLLRCAPWHPGGHDPVPPAGDRNRPHNRTTCAHSAEETLSC
ncbi:MAG TPA: membrane protein insertion efficiency factor YidD [Pseudonocardiaceae bacterium]